MNMVEYLAAKEPGKLVETKTELSRCSKWTETQHIIITIIIIILKGRRHR